LAETEEKSASLTARWLEEKKSVQDVQGLKEKLDAARQELDVAQRRGNLARAGELTYGVIPELERKLKTIEDKEGSALTNEAVTAEHMPESSRAGRASRRQDARREREEAPAHGEFAREAGCRPAPGRCARFRTRYAAPAPACRTQIGRSVHSSFLVRRGGKTELTKALAAFLFDDDSAMVRVDMSEFMEKHSVARLIARRPAMSVYEEGGSDGSRPPPSLSGCAVRRGRESASRVFNVLLQVLDDGRLTDGQGRTVDFRNTVIILNLQSRTEFLSTGESGESPKARARSWKPLRRISGRSF